MKHNFFKLLNHSLGVISAAMLLTVMNSGSPDYFENGNELNTTLSGNQKAVSLPLIFPEPQQFSLSEGNFELNEKTIILLPQNPSENDLHLARLLVKELSDKYGMALKTERVTKLPDNDYILMGSFDNPLVKEYCTRESINVTAKDPGPEGYILKAGKSNIVVAGSDPQGTFYGLQSLRQLIHNGGGSDLRCVDVRDWPDMSFRGIKLYIPGHENIPFYKRFISDFMALYKFNKVIIEVNAVMRFDRHPELNAGWTEFAEELHLSRRSRALGPGGYSQNSTHHDAGDGGILEKDEVRDLVRFSNQYYIEVIPEIPTLAHSFYLLSRHRELADVGNSEWPSTYCPSNPKTYDLLFDVFDEYIEVMQPKMIHIGRDEWWGAPKDYCPLCEGKDYFELFEKDLNKIYDYLAQKGIKVAMWGDHLLENVRGVGYVNRKSPTGYQYQTPGGLPLEMVKNKIPKDILIFNWFFNDQKNDSTLEELGFQQIYGNMLPDMSNWSNRKKLSGVIGGAPSSWAATTEFNFGKDLTGFFLGCANLLWSKKESLDPEEHFETVRRLMPSIHRNLDGIKYPGETGDPVVPVKIDPYFNTSLKDNLSGINLNTLKSGKISNGYQVFDLPGNTSGSGKRIITVGTRGETSMNLPSEVKSIKINEDASSLIFLHACAGEANNEKAYRTIFNFDDTSDLLGWYEIVYEDDYVETIPIRYGYNILEWNVKRSDNYMDWYDRGQGSSQDRYCYKADAVDCSSDMQGNPVSFFAFEWVNKRFGKKIKEINLKGTSNFINSQNKIIENNAIMLAAISIVKKREVPVIDPLK